MVFQYEAVSFQLSAVSKAALPGGYFIETTMEVYG
jgi:hypothetical protein